MTRHAAKRNRTQKQRTAMTLVEVMASLLVLGGAITGILLADSRSVAQIHAARQQIDAAEVARELVVNWRIEGVDLGAPSSGRARPDERWTWERTSGPRFIHEQIRMVEVVLRLRFQPTGQSDRTVDYEYHWLIHEAKN